VGSAPTFGAANPIHSDSANAFDSHSATASESSRAASAPIAERPAVISILPPRRVRFRGYRCPFESDAVVVAAVRNIMFGAWAAVRAAEERAVAVGTAWAHFWCFAYARVSSAQSAESVGVGCVGVARAVGV